MAHLRRFFRRDKANGTLTYLGEFAADDSSGSGGGHTFPPPPGPIDTGSSITDPSQPYDPYYMGGESPPPMLGGQSMQQAALLQNLQSSLNQDIEVVIPLNHWEQRTVVSGTTIEFRTPIFDLWWDHIKEEAGVTGGVVTGAGGSTPAAGSSIIQGIQWGNHLFEYTCKIITSGLTFLTGTVTMFCGMNMMGSDEPLQVSTMIILADVNKTDRSVFISGRVPMRFVQFRWSLTLDAPGADVDLMHQISVRST